MGKNTVLVIEDDDEARHFLIQILRYEGFDTLGFSNGAEALGEGKLLTRWDYDQHSRIEKIKKYLRPSLLWHCQRC